MQGAGGCAPGVGPRITRVPDCARETAPCWGHECVAMAITIASPDAQPVEINDRGEGRAVRTETGSLQGAPLRSVYGGPALEGWLPVPGVPPGAASPLHSSPFPRLLPDAVAVAPSAVEPLPVHIEGELEGSPAPAAAVLGLAGSFAAQWLTVDDSCAKDWPPVLGEFC